MSYAANMSTGVLWPPGHWCRMNPGEVQKQKKYVLYLRIESDEFIFYCLTLCFKEENGIFFSRITLKLGMHGFISNKPISEELLVLGTMSSTEFGAMCLPCPFVEKRHSSIM